MSRRKWVFKVFIEANDQPAPIEVWASSGHYGRRRAYMWERYAELTDAYNGWLTGLLETLEKQENSEGKMRFGWFNPYFRRGDKEALWIPTDRITHIYYTSERITTLGLRIPYAKIGGELTDETRDEIRQRRNQILFGGNRVERVIDTERVIEILSRFKSPKDYIENMKKETFDDLAEKFAEENAAINQAIKAIEQKEKLASLVEEICIESDELGLEPSIPSEQGSVITDRWRQRRKEIIKGGE